MPKLDKPCNCPAAPVPHRHSKALRTAPTISETDDSLNQWAHFSEHCYQQPGDCTPTRDLRHMLGDALEHWRDRDDKLARIADLEVHGREFVEAAELYAILGKPIPEPVDHAANIKERHND